MTTPAGAGPGRFAHLFSPLKIGTFTVPNRIMSTAHYTGFGSDGVPSERHINYWVSKAKGGIGLIMTEVQPVHPSSGTLDAMILAYRDDCIEPFRRLVQEVHEHDARIVAQLWHAGNTGSSQYDGLSPWAPSPIPSMLYGETPHEMTVEEIVAKNQADMVGMTRANIADPELPNKAREGRLDEIRYCIACNEGCWGRVTVRGGISCAINPSVGREKEMKIVPAPVKKKVMVVGGGIAGMEAARVAALRGHSVSLYEKEDRLGGQLQIAARAPGRQDMAEPVRYYEQQFKRLGVEVHLATPLSEEMVLREGADAVILATGGLPGKPDVPGIDSPMVVQARDVLMGTAEAGQNVVVYCADHGMEGLSTADFIAQQDKKVELVTPYPNFGANVEMITNMFVRGRLLMRGAVFTPLSRLVRVEEGAVVVSNAFLPIERRIEGVDTLVLAMGSVANDALFKALHGKVKELYTAGQCVSPRKMLESTYDGLRVGRMV